MESLPSRCRSKAWARWDSYLLPCAPSPRRSARAASHARTPNTKQSPSPRTVYMSPSPSTKPLSVKAHTHELTWAFASIALSTASSVTTPIKRICAAINAPAPNAIARQLKTVRRRRGVHAACLAAWRPNTCSSTTASGKQNVCATSPLNCATLKSSESAVVLSSASASALVLALAVSDSVVSSAAPPVISVVSKPIAWWASRREPYSCAWWDSRRAPYSYESSTAFEFMKTSPPASPIIPITTPTSSSTRGRPCWCTFAGMPPRLREWPLSSRCSSSASSSVCASCLPASSCFGPL
mmetsp:Transcript_71293/g.200879  ORF Transcript_71293/g.200879 Transcript_71293/m.200879 type:complete len:297 (-) Transcript_71293:288-1178(-)